jgi:uncharacterized membrane protein
VNLRLALYELAARQRVDRTVLAALCRRAGLEAEPPQAVVWLPRVLAALAAALAGLGVVFWVAAHWDAIGRFGQFALLQAIVAAVIAGAVPRGAARAPLALLALLGIGALLAFFGQTYQTGADPWLLFALWAALALPLALAARSDIVWAPWAVVAMAAVSLGVHAHTAHQWRFESQDLMLHLLAWGAAVALAVALGPALRRFTGAGVWSYRSALLLAVVAIGGSAICALFPERVAPHYGLGLAIAAVAFGALATRRGYDVFGLSAVAFAADVLLVAGAARWLFERAQGGDPIGNLTLLGLAAAALLAASVSLVMRIARARRTPEAP